jgi:hypothetical protein
VLQNHTKLNGYFIVLSLVCMCFMQLHAQTNKGPWQLNLKYHKNGKLELLNAQRIPGTKKNMFSPASKACLIEIPVNISWLDAKDNILASAKAVLPLGMRIPIGKQDGKSGILMSEEIIVIRVQGPSEDMIPARLIIAKQNTREDAERTKKTTTRAPALLSPHSFSLSTGSTVSPPPELSSTLGAIAATKIQDNGPDSNRLVIVVVGDGYVESDIADGTYAKDVNDTIDQFKLSSPWDEMMPATNIYRIDAVSLERGADYEDGSPEMSGSPKDTYFNTSFWTNGIERLLAPDIIGRTRAVNAADALIGAGMWDQIIVVVNSEKYGGSGQPLFATNSTHPDGPLIAVHEVGHSFANLADEYDYNDGATYSDEPPSEVNVDTNASNPKWSSWIEPSTPLPTPNESNYSSVVGAFEGAKYNQFGIYRPSKNCIMRSFTGSSGSDFCPVCREQHLRSLFEIVDTTDSVTPSTGAAVSVSSDKLFSVSPISMDGITFEWFIDGVSIPNKTSPNLTISTSQLMAPSQQVSVKVRFISPMMRSDTPVDTYSWSVANNGVTITGTPHWWLSFYGLGVADDVDLIDHDGDGVTTYEEYIADTNPTVPQGGGTDPGIDVPANDIPEKFQPNSPYEPALRLAVPAGKSRTVIARGANSTEGIALIEFNLLSNSDSSGTAPLANLSTRGNIGTGDNILIAGVVIQGSGTKRVLVTGRGASVPVAGNIANTQLRVVNQATKQVIATSDDYASEPGNIRIRAAGKAPTIVDSDAAVILDLAAGAYTVLVSGTGRATGVGIVEIFDINPASSARIVNLSTRGRVGTGANVMIGGLIAGGNSGEFAGVIARVTSPSSAAYDRKTWLADPNIEVFDGPNKVLENDDWTTE